MPQTHVLPGLGLDAAVRRVQRQSVLFYRDRSERAQDLPRPWPGATTLVLDGMRLEAWDGAVWVPLNGSSSGGGGTPGVTDHGALTGLGDDDHPQYLTDARADALFLTPIEGAAAFDPAGAAASGDAAHVGAADPHAAYLLPADVTPGSGIEVDATGSPGKAIVTALADSSEWLWTAAAVTGDPGSTRVGVDNANIALASVLRISANSLRNVPRFIEWLRAGDNLAVRQEGGSTNRFRVRVIGNVTINAGWYSIPVQPISGVEPTDGSTVTVIAYLASGAGTGITQADADLRYVNVTGDTMTGPLGVTSIAGTGDIISTGRIKPRYQAVAGLAPVTPATTFTVLPTAALAGAEQLGGVLIGANYINLPVAGLYAYSVVVVVDRDPGDFQLTVQAGGANINWLQWPTSTHRQRSIAGLYYASAAVNLAVLVQCSAGVIAAGNAASVFSVVSHF